MPLDLSGKWDLELNENVEDYLKALSNPVYSNFLNIDFAHRKIGSYLSPTKIIIQDGENFMIKTQSTFKSYEFSFTVGVETEEFTKGLDNRILKTLVTWEGHTLVAIQKGEKPNRGWRHWMEGERLYLELTCGDVICYQVYKRKHKQEH